MLLVGLAYHTAPRNDFHFDDLPHIRENPAVRISGLSGAGLVEAARRAPLERRPLPYVTFALDWWRGGGEPGAFQWTNLGLHAASSLLVFTLLLLVLGGDRGRDDPLSFGAALGGAALWAVHPIQVQAVTYVVQRMAELAALFSLLAVFSFLRGRFAPDRRRALAWYALCGVSVVAGALSKENAWIAPALLLLAELAVARRDRPLFRSAPERAIVTGLLLVAVAFLVATAAGLGPIAGHFGPGYASRDFSLAERVLTQPRVILFHLSQIVWPLPGRFSLEHDFVTSSSLTSPATTLPSLILVIAGCAAGLWLLRSRRYRPAAFFLLWLPATLVIESSVVPLEMVFEHRMYLPGVGLAGLAALGIRGLGRRIPRPALTLGLPLAMVLGLLTASTMARVEIWRTPRSLAANSVRVAPASARAWSGLGQVLLREGDVGGAEDALRRSLELDPDDPLALEFLGVLLFDRGQIEEARSSFERALLRNPESTSLANHLGEALLRQSRPDLAQLHFRAAAERKPWVPAYHWNLALALEELGRCAEARDSWDRYLGVETEESERARARGHLTAVHHRPGGRCYPPAAPG